MPEQAAYDVTFYGDFNVVDENDATYQALIKEDFRIPEGMQFKTNVKQSAYYDQIALRDIDQKFEFTGKSGAFAFFENLFTEADFDIYHDLMSNTQLRDFDERTGNARSTAEKKDYYLSKWRTWQLSDHLPLWVEMKIDFSDDYLHKLKAEIVARPTDNP